MTVPTWANKPLSAVVYPHKRGDFMQTFTARAFWPLDPNPADIEIRDIAHSLAMQCRYAGHCRKFYCPTPEQRVLTADLKWIPAGDLSIGDELLGFDEHPIEVGSTGKKRRRHRHAVVLHTQPVKRHTLRLVMSDGSEVVSSQEHPWLVATKVSRNQKWLTADEIRNDISLGRKRYMHKFFEPWSTSPSRQAGWLAGIYDGEGYLSTSNRKGTLLGVAQNPGIVLDSIKDAVMSLGFSAQAPRKTGSVNSSVVTLQTMGGWKEITRFLGEIRPIRLLEKFKTRLRDGEMDKQMEGRCDPLEIVRVVDEGEQWVSGIETSTHTYFCEGYGAHNSVAEHSVLLADWMLGVAPEHALWALLHDASEAYMVDVPRPLKHSMPDYLAAERQVMRAVCRRFQLPDAMPALVHEADQDIIADELVNMEYMPWHDKHSEPLGVTLRYWSPGEAKEAFLNMYDTLVSMREKEAA